MQRQPQKSKKLKIKKNKGSGNHTNANYGSRISASKRRKPSLGRVAGNGNETNPIVSAEPRIKIFTRPLTEDAQIKTEQA